MTFPDIYRGRDSIATGHSFKLVLADVVAWWMPTFEAVLSQQLTSGPQQLFLFTTLDSMK